MEISEVVLLEVLGTIEMSDSLQCASIVYCIDFQNSEFRCNFFCIQSLLKKYVLCKNNDFMK